MNSGYFYAPYLPLLNTPEVLNQQENEMADDLTVLRENNSAEAEFVQAWREKYERAYDFSKDEDQATFYEGAMEMARHIAITSKTGSLDSICSTHGVSQIVLNSTPHQD